MDFIPENKQLEPYFKIAEDEARKSPCVRRQYGAVIIDVSEGNIHFTAENNSRVSNCCRGFCVRNEMDLPTDGRHISVEVGAEVHAETAALIAHNRLEGGTRIMVLVGFKGQRELLSEDVWPCHVCALNLKFAGIRYVYIRNIKRNIVPCSVSEIIDYREEDWQTDV